MSDNQIQDQIQDYLSDVEQRCREFRHFQSLGGKIDLELKSGELTNSARLAAIDVLRLVRICRDLNKERKPQMDTEEPRLREASEVMA